MARPISRWAMANRVKESIINNVSIPRLLKNSAIAVATKAALKRTRGGWSDVATTSTERCSPSSFKSFSMNSLTSRPLSPISAITLTSARVLRAIMPRSVLLPTPLPEKIPNLCPRPQVSKPSMALIPNTRGVCIRCRFRGCGGILLRVVHSWASTCPFPSSGFPKPSSILPIKPKPTDTINFLFVSSTLLPGPIPSRSP